MGGTTKATVTEVEVAGRTVRLSSPDRVIFPQRGFTKADVFHYYLAVGDGIMRALRDRPTTLQRFPEGIEGEAFFSKRVPARGGTRQCPSGRPTPRGPGRWGRARRPSARSGR